MPTRLRFLLVAVVLGAIGAVAVVLSGDGGSPKAGPTFLPGTAPGTPLPPICEQAPAPEPTPKWFPRDLPLPTGSYPSKILPSRGELHTAVFTVKASLGDFLRHISSEWARKGWALGIGESEPGEAEDTFISSRGGRNRVGRFIARSVYCDPNLTWLLLQLSLAG